MRHTHKGHTQGTYTRSTYRDIHKDIVSTLLGFMWMLCAPPLTTKRYFKSIATNPPGHLGGQFKILNTRD